MDLGQLWRKWHVRSPSLPAHVAPDLGAPECSVLVAWPSGWHGSSSLLPPTRHFLPLEFVLRELSRSVQKNMHSLGNWDSPWPTEGNVLSSAVAFCSHGTLGPRWEFQAALAFEEPTVNVKRGSEALPLEGMKCLCKNFLKVLLSYEQSLSFCLSMVLNCGLIVLWMLFLHCPIMWV